jgi:hypothetical protein
MSSKSINITDYKEAILSGIIPGSFSEDRKKFVFPTLRYTNQKNSPLEWTLELYLKKDEYVNIDLSLFGTKLDSTYLVELVVSSCQVGGKTRNNTPTIVRSGKNIGKKNETNVLEQGFRDALSLYNKQLKKTKCASSPSSQSSASSQSNPSSASSQKNHKPPPMLIQWLNGSSQAVLTDKDFEDGVTLQRKYNGVRYVTFMHEDEIIQYSRTGSEYHPAEYLNNELKKLLKNESVYLDGELYLHGKSLAYISGQARKENDKEYLNYYVFDLFWPNDLTVKSRDRQLYLDQIFKKVNCQYVKRVENFTVNNMDQVVKLTQSFIKEGYEGSVARKDIKEYKYSFNNYHSSNVLKIKPVQSDEFKVVGFTEGKKGKDVGKVIWMCEVNTIIDPNDVIFTVVPNMSLDQRDILFKCLTSNNNLFDKYIKGKLITLEYSELSNKTGKPLQAKAIAFRTYENQNDPIKKILKICNIN